MTLSKYDENDKVVYEIFDDEIYDSIGEPIIVKISLEDGNEVYVEPKENARGRCPKDSYEQGTFKCDPSMSDVEKEELIGREKKSEDAKQPTVDNIVAPDVKKLSNIIEKVKEEKEAGQVSEESKQELKEAVSEANENINVTDSPVFSKLPTDLNPAYVSEIKTSYDNLTKDIPHADKAIKSIEVVDTDFTIGGRKVFESPSAMASSHKGTIYLNKALMNLTPEKLTYERKENTKIGFHPPGCDTLKSAIDHEAGHIIYDYLKEIQTYSLTDDVVFSPKTGWGIGSVGGTIKEWEKANIKLAPPSDYAERDRKKNKETNEMWAEGFTSMRNTPPEKQGEYAKKMTKLFKFLKEAEWKEMSSKTRTTTVRDPKIKALKAKIGIGK